MDLTPGIVVRVFDYQDYDSILHIYTRDFGLLSVLARGIKKPLSKNRPACELLAYGEFELFRAFNVDKMSKLKTAHLISSFPNIFQNYNNLVFVDYFLQLYDQAFKNQPSTFLFKILLQLLITWNENKIDNLRLFLFYQLKLLAPLGLKLILNECVYCHNKNNIYAINFFAGGLVCKTDFNPETDFKVPLSLLKSLIQTEFLTFRQVEKWVILDRDAIQLLSLLVAFLDQQLIFANNALKKVLKKGNDFK